MGWGLGSAASLAKSDSWRYCRSSNRTGSPSASTWLYTKMSAQPITLKCCKKEEKVRDMGKLGCDIWEEWVGGWRHKIPGSRADSSGVSAAARTWASRARGACLRPSRGRPPCRCVRRARRARRARSSSASASASRPPKGGGSLRRSPRAARRATGAKQTRIKGERCGKKWGATYGRNGWVGGEIKGEIWEKWGATYGRIGWVGGEIKYLERGERRLEPRRRDRAEEEADEDLQQLRVRAQQRAHARAHALRPQVDRALAHLEQEGLDETGVPGNL